MPRALKLSLPTSATPRSPAFAHIEDKNLRSDKELLQELQFLVARYPRRSRELADAIEEIEHDMGPKPTSPPDAVLFALEAGRHTVNDIVEHTHLPYGTVYDLLHKRPLIDLIEIRECPQMSEPGRGGARRSQNLYSLRHTLP